jgi:hypothetical protein
MTALAHQSIIERRSAAALASLLAIHQEPRLQLF